jgi:plastocyanin
LTLILSKYRRGLIPLLALALSALLVLSFACGGDDDDDSGGDDETTAATTPAEDGNGGEVEFDVVMTDNAFTPTEFTVAAGAVVTFNLSNDGAAIHNMRIAGEDGEYNSDDDAVSDPDIVTGGGTATLEWTAPDEASEIDFQCDFHPTDMLGTITVE